jgi:ABC-type amino acid transport substrate-binding protein
MQYVIYSFFIFATLTNIVFASAGKINVAVFLEPPYIDLVDNKLVGENIDIVNYLTQAINLEPVFIQCPPVRCLTMVKQGQVDMLIGLSKSSLREKDLIYIEPPYLLQHQPLRFFTLKTQQLTITQFSDLNPLLVGTLRGAIYFPEFDKNREIKKVELTTRIQLVNMLLKGRIDTFLEREESVSPLLSPTEYQNKFVMADYQYNKPINSYIVLSRHSSAKRYTKELSRALAKAIVDGTIQKIRTTSRKTHKKGT